MEVHLSSDLQAKLSKLSHRRGRDSDALIAEAVERLVNHEEWFVSEVEMGLGQVEAGRTLSHEEVGARLDRYLSSRQLHASYVARPLAELASGG